MPSLRATGSLGEDLACRFLKKKGYKILKRNLNERHGEIDILARDRQEKTLVFIEVKTRSNTKYGLPREAVGFFKSQKIIKAVYSCLAKHKIKDPFRVDFIGITLDYQKKIARIEHIKNAIEENANF